MSVLLVGKEGVSSHRGKLSQENMKCIGQGCLWLHGNSGGGTQEYELSRAVLFLCAANFMLLTLH